MITKEISTLCDNIDAAGHIGVKTITKVVEDGVVLSQSFHRKVLSPGDDISGEPPEVQAVARGVWTPAVVAPMTAAQQTEIDALTAKTAELTTATAALKVAQAERDAASANGKPVTVTMRQAQLALLGAGLLPVVEAAIAAIPGDAGIAAKITWEKSSTVERTNPLIVQLAGVIPLTEAQIDALFVAAAKL